MISLGGTSQNCLINKYYEPIITLKTEFRVESMAFENLQLSKIVGKKGIFYPCSSLPEEDLLIQLENTIDEFVNEAIQNCCDTVADPTEYIENNNLNIQNYDSSFKIEDIEFENLNDGRLHLAIYVIDFNDSIWQVCWISDNKSVSELISYCIEAI
jgi:hypothetical protein